MGFFEELLRYCIKEAFGHGKSRYGDRDFNYTRGHKYKTNTVGVRLFGVNVREVSGTCNRCNGSGTLTFYCRTCSGSGKYMGTCRTCAGTGLFTFASGKQARCKRCDGTGTFTATCKKCSGSGLFTPTCKKCGGSGTYKRTYYS
jgi:DnaJ-class molecular chaperone